jgi:predicted acyl esterase
MTTADSLNVEIVHNLHVPVRDGVRLAANLYRPAGAGPVPCLVNYLPYHKDGRGHGAGAPTAPGGERCRGQVGLPAAWCVSSFPAEGPGRPPGRRAVVL